MASIGLHYFKIIAMDVDLGPWRLSYVNYEIPYPRIRTLRETAGHIPIKYLGTYQHSDPE